MERRKADLKSTFTSLKEESKALQETIRSILEKAEQSLTIIQNYDDDEFTKNVNHFITFTSSQHILLQKLLIFNCELETFIKKDDFYKNYDINGEAAKKIDYRDDATTPREQNYCNINLNSIVDKCFKKCGFELTPTECWSNKKTTENENVQCSDCSSFSNEVMNNVKKRCDDCENKFVARETEIGKKYEEIGKRCDKMQRKYDYVWKNDGRVVEDDGIVEKFDDDDGKKFDGYDGAKKYDKTTRIKDKRVSMNDKIVDVDEYHRKLEENERRKKESDKKILEIQSYVGKRFENERRNETERQVDGFRKRKNENLSTKRDKSQTKRDKSQTKRDENDINRDENDINRVENDIIRDENDIKRDKNCMRDEIRIKKNALKSTENALKLNESSLKLTENTFKSTENCLKYAGNSLKYAESSLKYAENSLKYTDNSLKYKENSLKYTKNSLKHTENALTCSEWVENTSKQLTENILKQHNKNIIKRHNENILKSENENVLKSPNKNSFKLCNENVFKVQTEDALKQQNEHVFKRPSENALRPQNATKSRNENEFKRKDESTSKYSMKRQNEPMIKQINASTIKQNDITIIFNEKTSKNYEKSRQIKNTQSAVLKGNENAIESKEEERQTDDEAKSSVYASADSSIYGVSDSDEIPDGVPPKVNDLVIISSSLSPWEFYINPVNDQLETLYNLSQQLSEHQTSDAVFSHKADALNCICRYCLVYSDQWETWFRAEIVDWIEEDNTLVKIQYIDYGDYETVPYTDLYVLPSKFYTIPRFAIKCNLAFLYPPNSTTESIEYKWPRASINIFKSLLNEQDKFYKITFVDQSDELFGVDLVTDNGKEDEKSLGELMIESKAAVEIIHVKEIPIRNPFMLEQLKTARGIGGMTGDEIDVERAIENAVITEHGTLGEAIESYEAQDEARICKFTRKNGSCYKGVNCRFEHEQLQPDGTTTDKQIVYKESLNKLEIPAVGEMSYVMISCVYKFNTLYIQLESQECSLIALSKLLNGPKVRHAKLRLLPASGQIVLARITDGQWYRAMVVDVDSDYSSSDLITRVFLVDYGDLINVPLKDIKAINEDYLLLPFQAIMCTLNGIVSSPGVDEVKAREYVEANFLCQKLQCIVTDNTFDMLETQLFDSDSQNIADVLVKEGFAMHKQ